MSWFKHMQQNKIIFVQQIYFKFILWSDNLLKVGAQLKHQELQQ